jgi:hypothetical protein
MYNYTQILILQNIAFNAPCFDVLQERGVYALQIPFWIWICVAVMAVVFAAIFAIIYVAVVRRTPTNAAADTRTQGANVYIRVDSKEPNAAKSQNQGSILGRL